MTESGASVDVLLLGPIEVRAGAERLAVSGTKLQALVALLALTAPRPVSDDRLIEELWGDAQPGNPANALQAQISALRRVLGTQIVQRDGSGYALSIEPERVDARRVERLVHDGRASAAESRHDEAAAHFGAAVSLVRGPPLDDLLDFAFAREAATRLEQLVIAAHEGFVDAELASGRHADVVHQLTDLVRLHPLCERFHEQLILSLFRCGRQSDALRAYQDVREMLVTEMGLEPGPALQALERAVLSHDPVLAAPVPLTPRARDAAPPPPLTTFVGRTTELQELADVMTIERMVTVVGPGGVGKTRLVSEMARGLAPTQERWFVDLAPVNDARGVPEAVASTVGALDVAPRGAVDVPRTPQARTIERFGDRDVLLVLDSCEHVLAAASDFAHQMLLACPAVKIVATSREPLGTEGEQQVVVGPLDDDDATALFETRAKAVQPRFRTEEGTSTLVDLCRHLDGLPLAIELAAARTKTLPVPEIAARLQDRFRLLVGTKPSDDGRQHGLRTTIDWSYDILFEDEQRAFRSLAVFSGGATSQAAQTVCGDDALDLVSRLVDKSLLLADTSGATARFRMLESLRAYGLDRLAESDELEESLAQHAQWCIELAEATERGIRGPDQIAWLDRLDVEHDNLRAALAGCVDRDAVAGLRLIGALVLPWWFRGRGREARHWVEELLARAPDAPAPVLAKVLTWSGLLADFGPGYERPGGLERELELAEERQRRALVQGDAARDPGAAADTMAFLALTLTRRALAGVTIDRSEILDLVEASAAGFARVGDDFGISMVRTVETVGWLAAGDVAQTTTALQTARTYADTCGNRYVLGRTEWIEGLLASAAGDAALAYRHIERGLLLLDELGMGQEVTVQAELLVELADRRGEPDLAAQWRRFVASRGSGLARHDVLIVASARNREALRARSAGDLVGSRAGHLEARTAYVAAGTSRGIAFTESCLGFLAAEMGDAGDALQHHVAALDAATTASEPACIALALEGTAASFGDGDAEWAAQLLGAAATLWGESEAKDSASHRPDIEAIDDRVRRAIDAESYAAAFERGTRMGSPAAVLAARTGAVAPV